MTGAGLQIALEGAGRLLDGRNRLEAAERVGLNTSFWMEHTCIDDPVAFIISKNIHRRYLTKQLQADLIVAAFQATKGCQLGEVSKDGRGKVDEDKAKIVATAKAENIGKRTTERAIAKAKAPSAPTPPKVTYPKPTSRKPVLRTFKGIEAATKCYLDQCADPDVDLIAVGDIVRHRDKNWAVTSFDAATPGGSISARITRRHRDRFGGSRYEGLSVDVRALTLVEIVSFAVGERVHMADGEHGTVVEDGAQLVQVEATRRRQTAGGEWLESTGITDCARGQLALMNKL